MSYNSYNTRNSGRYNMSGRFASGGEQQPYRQNQRQYQQQSNNSPQEQEAPQQPPSPLQPVEELDPTLQETDIDMREDTCEGKEYYDNSKPYWSRSKLSGVKKITNKERRRRQNENLRRLLAPKNALMVLNEMMPGEHEAAQFKVEPAPPHPYYNAPNAHSFCAELTVDGVGYKGYGDNKVAARNDAAEQAIRDLIIKRLSKGQTTEGPSATAAEDEGQQASAEEEQALPMIQLASFALHKLFAEWECDGHKVPHLKPVPPVPPVPQSPGESGSEPNTPSTPAGPRPKPSRALPADAATMHPCMLLTYMRPHLEYRELAVDGDRPQNMMFTMGIVVDGATYIGKATNKREARKQAARKACSTLFGVVYPEALLVAPEPVSDPGAAPPAAAAVPAPAPVPSPTESEDA